MTRFVETRETMDTLELVACYSSRIHLVCVCVLTNPTRLRCIPQCTLSLSIRKTPLLCNLVSTKGVYVHNTCVTEGGDGKGQKAIVVVIVKSPYVRFNPI